ncbi:MAG: DUF6693 family protein [Candidatus Sumerlaeia bacterium]|nr:DUF6693 family protein [Candidatus Sumerlaeia bacterium]
MKRYKFVCTIDLGDVLLQAVLWALLIFVTCGLAAPLFGYYFVRLLINHTEMHEIA